MDASFPIAIGDIAVRQYEGLFSLNDLHKASGGAKKHQPALFLRLDQTKELIAEIQSTDSQTAVQAINGGANRGTYASREVVIAYAGWISAPFHLRVIRVFLTATAPQSMHLPDSPSSVRDRLPLYLFVAHTVVERRLLFSKVYQFMNIFAGTRRFKEMTREQVTELMEFCDRFAIGQDTSTDWRRIVDNQSKLYGTPRQLDMVQQLLIA